MGPAFTGLLLLAHKLGEGSSTPLLVFHLC